MVENLGGESLLLAFLGICSFLKQNFTSGTFKWLLKLVLTTWISLAFQILKVFRKSREKKGYRRMNACYFDFLLKYS